MKNKLVLIQKHEINPGFKKNLKLRNNTNFEIEEVLKKFKGFEGKVVFYYYEIDNYIELQEFLRACQDILQKEKKPEQYAIFFVCIPDSNIPDIVKKEAKKIGFDYGILENSLYAYSSIFNEILFGNVSELISFKDNLNDWFLFQTLNIAEDYCKVHHKVSDEGRNKKVELEDNMHIYEIWKFPLEKEE